MVTPLPNLGTYWLPSISNIEQKDPGSRDQLLGTQCTVDEGMFD